MARAADSPQAHGLHSGRWIALTAATTVLVIAAAAVVTVALAHSHSGTGGAAARARGPVHPSRAGRFDGSDHRDPGHRSGRRRPHRGRFGSGGLAACSRGRLVPDPLLRRHQRPRLRGLPPLVQPRDTQRAIAAGVRRGVRHLQGLAGQTPQHRRERSRSARCSCHFHQPSAAGPEPVAILLHLVAHLALPGQGG